MLFLLPFILQILVQSDKVPAGISVESAEFPAWVDFTRCVSDGMELMPSAVEARSPLFDAISKKCKDAVREKMNNGLYKDIASKSDHSSRKKVEAVLDGTDLQLRATYLRFPDIAKVNARIESMGLGVTVYDPIAHLYDQYSRCVSQKYNKAPFRHLTSERVEGWKNAIKSCERLKASLKLDAEPIMARQPDFQDPVKREKAISATFDGHDEMVVKAASIEWAEPEQQ